MQIGGLQKMTLLDYPEHIACTVFLNGCNFNCPFCYNSSLINVENKQLITTEEFFSFLNSRKGKLDGVAITGGEPLLQKDIIPFIQKIKEMGFLIKLDTNGSFPDKLSYLIEQKLVDYVAMDIKNTFEKYPITTSCFSLSLDNIKKSIKILLENKVDYEFRTTIVKEFHEIDDFILIGQSIKGAKRYFLQSYQDKDSVLTPNLHPLSKEELLKCLEVVKKYVLNASLRGID